MTLSCVENVFKPWQTVKERGIAAIPCSARHDAESLIEDLKAHGLFVVPVGELESWYDNGESRTRKPEWLMRALEDIASGKCDEALVHAYEFIKDALVRLAPGRY